MNPFLHAKALGVTSSKNQIREHAWPRSAALNSLLGSNSRYYKTLEVHIEVLSSCNHSSLWGCDMAIGKAAVQIFKII